MDSSTIFKPPTTLRWGMVAANMAVWVVFAWLTITGAARHADLLQTLGLTAIALSTYAWVLFPPAGSILMNVMVFFLLSWAWAVLQTSVLGIDLIALGLLLFVAAVHQRRRARRFKRMQQLLDDLGEERRVKDQAITLVNQTREALQKKLARYTQLQSIAEELSNMTDLRAIARLAVERTFTLVGKSDVCLLFLVDREQQELSLFASKKRDAISNIRAKHGDQFDRYILRTHRPLLVNDVRRDFRFTVAMSSERTISSVIACPLMHGQSPEGVLRLDSTQPEAYTQDDLRFLDILLDLVATAMTNARLFAQTQQLAMTDGLTGLTLRRPFLEHLTRELVRAGRSRESASILMLDVDHFKEYNDLFGHTAGDLVLKGVAEVLMKVVPPGAVVARYGGEEFAVLLPRLVRHQASDVAEEIRRFIEQRVQGSSRGHVPTLQSTGTAVSPSRTGVDQEQRRVTVSVGVSTFPEDAQAELELIRMADQRLYQAKRSGRNLVCAA